MKERPILFSAPMVRAILDGSKTQTRRIVKMPIDLIDRVRFARAEFADKSNSGQCGAFWAMEGDIPVGPPISCKYGQPGDRLWVRETFMDLQGTGVEHRDQAGRRQRFAYAADTLPGSYSDEIRKDYGLKWKPSIHMPRAASRILLEIVSVRVERLQDISEADAKAEGAPAWTGAEQSYRTGFYNIWKQINGAGSWDANPWVWVVEFKRVAP